MRGRMAALPAEEGVTVWSWLRWAWLRQWGVETVDCGGVEAVAGHACSSCWWCMVVVIGRFSPPGL